jgi:CDP-diglyceride synthetase
VALTAVWLLILATGRDGGIFYSRYQVDLITLRNVFFGFLFMTVLWGWLWYGIRRGLLKSVAGFSNEELKEVFSSRMNRPFDLAPYLARHSERRIRILDMVGRRGRFITLGAVGFYHLYARIAQDPAQNRQFLTVVLQDGLFDAVLLSWVALAAYRSDGFLGRVFYGAQSRLMDGTLARANCLLITTLWAAFRLVMVPIGVQLSARFPTHTYAALFGFVWLSYMAADALSEIVGALFGKQKLRVWGLGDVNRKSVEGTVAGFVGSLAVCLLIVSHQGLPSSWLWLALAVSISNTTLELFSPRGTDDFTMATANALLCWAFGVWVYPLAI